MDYNIIYQKYYDQNYLKFEKIIKLKFIKSKIKKRSFGSVLNEILQYLDYEYPKRVFISKNDFLKSLFDLFNNRYSFYEEDAIHEVLKNKVKKEFEKNEITFFDKNYSFNELIKEIAFLNVAQEIRRLLQNNSRFFELFYITNEYDEFEIKEYSPTRIENTALYIKLNKIVYPEYYKNSFPSNHNEEVTTEILSINQLIDKETLKFNITKFSVDEKIFILSVCYNKKNNIPQTEFLKLMMIFNNIEDYSIFYEKPNINKLYRKFNEGLHYMAESKRREFIINIIDKIDYFNLKSFKEELNLIKKKIK